MLRSVANLKVQTKLLLIVIISLSGFIVDTLYRHSLMEKVSINGPVYKKIEIDKDLLADILPPPEFIIEAYLTVLQMRSEKDLESLEKLVNKFEALKKEYLKKNEFWKQELQNKDLKTALTEKSYDPAMIFFEIAEKQFLPAVRSHDTVKIDTLITGSLKNAFDKHKSAIVNTVNLANEDHLNIEKSAEKTIRRTQISSMLLTLIILGLIISLFFYIKGDITERKRAEDKLRESEGRLKELNANLENINRELAAANKDLESFSYSVAHDLRNPLKVISNLTDFLIEDYAERLDEEGKSYLNNIKSGTERMNSIIGDMLALSKVSRQEIEIVDVDISEMARLSINELCTADPNRKVEVKIQEGLKARADARLISVTLANLLGNAWKYTSKTENPKIEFGSFEKDGQRVFYVKDNGVGFDMRQAAKLFTPFQRLHSEKEFKGTGVGLAIVERAISRHGGKVWAEGEVGKGATIYFTL